jgi:hypothetical protein
MPILMRESIVSAERLIEPSRTRLMQRRPEQSGLRIFLLKLGKHVFKWWNPQVLRSARGQSPLWPAHFWLAISLADC